VMAKMICRFAWAIRGFLPAAIYKMKICLNVKIISEVWRPFAALRTSLIFSYIYDVN
jgi:hypothetical protein